jgi:hypothetical protein
MKYTDLEGSVTESEVWSPGPVATSVWLVNGTCVKWVAKSKSWNEILPPELTHGREEQYQTFRISCRYSSRLSEKLWKEAIQRA